MASGALRRWSSPVRQRNASMTVRCPSVSLELALAGFCADSSLLARAWPLSRRVSASVTFIPGGISLGVTSGLASANDPQFRFPSVCLGDLNRLERGATATPNAPKH